MRLAPSCEPVYTTLCVPFAASVHKLDADVHKTRPYSLAGKWSVHSSLPYAITKWAGDCDQR